MNTRKIIALDDEPLIPPLMRELIEIEGERELEITHVAAEAESFLDSIVRHPFDAAIIDISLGEPEGGIGLLHVIKSKGIDLPSIILSAHDEIDYAMKCLSAGAKGYVNKNQICAALIPSLKAVLNGDIFVSGEKGEQIVEVYRSQYLERIS